MEKRMDFAKLSAHTPLEQGYEVSLRRVSGGGDL